MPSSPTASGCGAGAGTADPGRICVRPARRSTRSGAIPWSERARRGATRGRRGAAGAAVPDARDQLTPHELQIAQLAAEGLTNREIGQRLYLSHRTVSSHLHRIFPKLGITARSELRTVLAYRNRSRR